MRPLELRPAAEAFDAVAPAFDDRFGAWLSVGAQREAVRKVLQGAFPPKARLLELGGGTGEDARWLAERGFEIFVTDPSPEMVRIAANKLAPYPACRVGLLAAEDLAAFTTDRADQGQFDGVYSNFAALNCVDDLAPVGNELSRLIRPGGAAVLVVFGSFCPGEIVVEVLRGRPRSAFRRFHRDKVDARLAGRKFTVTYHRGSAIAHAMAPWFDLEQRVGIGIFVPPSAAEPWISSHPAVLRTLQNFDCRAQRRLALLGDHILYLFRRNRVPS